MAEEDEGQFFEYKPADTRPSELATSLAAFANAEGGTLILGVAERLVQGCRSHVIEGIPDPTLALDHNAPAHRDYVLGGDRIRIYYVESVCQATPKSLPPQLNAHFHGSALTRAPMVFIRYADGKAGSRVTYAAALRASRNSMAAGSDEYLCTKAYKNSFT